MRIIFLNRIKKEKMGKMDIRIENFKLSEDTIKNNKRQK